jgi:hypothetical protein
MQMTTAQKQNMSIADAWYASKGTYLAAMLLNIYLAPEAQAADIGSAS